MSRFDFNKPLDLALATQSVTTDLLNAFARDRTVWSISEGSYTGGRKTAKTILFHVFKSRSDYQAGLARIVDSSGRRKAKFSFPYVDGQTTDDLGRKGESFDVEIMFHGPTYKAGLNRLMKELNDPVPGTLEHPVRGTVRCGAEDWSLEHAHDSKQAVLLRVRFVEHNFDTAAFSDIIVIKTVKSRLQAVIDALKAVAAVLQALKQIVGSIVSLVNNIKRKIEEFYNGVVNLIADASSAFGLKGGDLTAILPINVGGTLAVATALKNTQGGVNPNAGIGGTSVTSDGFIRVSTRFTTVVSPTDPFANLPVELLGDVARQAIEQTQLARRAEVLRQQANELALDIDAAIEATKSAGPGSLGRAAATLQTLVDTKVATLRACDSTADLLTAGSSNGRPAIIEYTVPRTMSIREVAFANGLTPQDGVDIATLNPALLSTNYITKGTVVRVPTFV